MSELTDDIVQRAKELPFTYEIVDSEVPWLSLRVSSGGAREFVVRGALLDSWLEDSFPIAETPTVMEARERARGWWDSVIAEREHAYAILSSGIDQVIAAPNVVVEPRVASGDEYGRAQREAPEYTLGGDIRGGFRELLLQVVFGRDWYRGIKEHRRTGHRYNRKR